MASGSASTAVAPAKSADDLLAQYRAESTPAPNAPFVWKPSSPGNADGLSDFLEAHLPSTTTSRGGSRHIWVTIPYKRQSSSRSDNDMKFALAQAHHAFAELSTSCQAIEDNDKIPQRQNRKQGMSKGQRKKVLIDDFGASLPRWADEGGLLTGKWLMFKDDKWVDYGFRTLAYSIIDGPLSQCKSANVHTVKVDCADHRKNGEQLISLFYEDVWDEAASTEIARIMLRHHCQYSRAAKTDLHSALGINSKVKGVAISGDSTRLADLSPLCAHSTGPTSPPRSIASTRSFLAKRRKSSRSSTASKRRSGTRRRRKGERSPVTARKRVDRQVERR
ncbi:hypothetical protein BDZ90DRAFT_67107 [Jaminaea rosea]|uniref:Uncharacterized protein n=1 Tax=Jaminaea rosea TaxID=1569628 RepID=A0A316UJW0_9BASI|nr:hypothetical protein BDZ90DRAFT_67107 [Jaminaea rosea]PWN25509.1 hypothetical protein BDZ90DRAFT_67107 [Jaminaea rosea]